MNTNELFIGTLKDLNTKIESNDPYEILMAGALLRKLLVDDNPVVDQINRQFKLKINFIVNDRQLPAVTHGLSFWSLQDGFDPDTSVPHLSKPLTVNKDNMLKRPVLFINGTIITVLDLIKFLSHVQGAVHSGNPKEIKEKTLKKVEKTFTVGGMPAGIRTVCAISRVVLKGLEPLRQKVLSQ